MPVAAPRLPRVHESKGLTMGVIRTTAAPGVPASFPFSLACEARDVCFISGMPALNSDGALAAGAFQQETELAWRHTMAIVEAAGYSVENIVYVQCVLADIADYSELNDWWRRQFPDSGSAPARFTFQAGALPFGAKFEFQAVVAASR
jgi:2-iminobutanoate/2-iminopropanoate deaminase